MAGLRRFILRLYNCLRPIVAERELARELESHLSLIEDQCRQQGMTDADARRVARRQLGGLQQAKEHHRSARSFDVLNDLGRDTRYAIRTLAQSPGFTCVAVLTLALGIGANTAIFSIVNAVLLTPIHVPDASRLVRFVTIRNGDSSPVAGSQEFAAWQAQSAITDIAAHRLEFINLTSESNPEQLPVARVSQNFFRLFSIAAIRGRIFSRDEDRPGGPAVAILSYEFWTRRFNADPEVVDRTIRLGSIPYTVIGILAPNFDSGQFDPRPDVWLPFQIDPTRIDGGNLFLVAGQLKRGATLDTANAQLAASRVAYEQRLSIPHNPAVTWAAQSLQDAMVSGVRLSLQLLLAAVFLVLLIACANVASLLTVRGSARQREIAIRMAIGAGRGRVMRQLLTESLLLCAIAGVAGLIIATLAVRGLLAAYPTGDLFIVAAENDPIQRMSVAGASLIMDWRVFAFTCAVSAVATVAFGLLPAMQSARVDVKGTLKAASAATSNDLGRPRLRTVLVIVQIALAFVLLVGAALLIRSSLALRAVAPGFDSDHVLTMFMSISGTPFEKRAGIAALTRNGASEVAAVPGVRRVSTTCCVPLEIVWQLPFVIASRAGVGLTRVGNAQFHAYGGWTFVSPGYFDVFKIPIVKGRDFTDRDDASAPGVVIINEAMARRFWPDGNPLSDQLIIGRGMRPEYDQDSARQIIGIVGNVRDLGLHREPRPEMYVPVAQIPDGVTTLNVRLLPLVWIVRTAPEPYSLARPISQALESASGGLPVFRVRSMSDVVSASTARRRFDMWLMTIFGCIAMTLAAIGIYGLIAYVVRQRTHEIGIRLALGQDSRGVRNLILKQGLSTALVGAAIGAVAAFAAARVLASLLFSVKPHDPVIFTVTLLTFLAVATGACYVPARRATKVDPLVAIRYE